MKHISFFISLLIIISGLLSSINIFSQGILKDKEYKPEPGQEGKDVRWFPTPQALVEKMLDMAEITSSDFLIDLGSGDGRTVITAARRGVHAIGIEYNRDLVELSKRNAIKEGLKDKVEFIEADLFAYDFSRATVITMFLLPEINLKLRPRLLELKPGTKILSTTFTMQNWPHDKLVKIEDKTSKWTTAYLWIVPAKAGGIWEFSGGEMKLKQQFQMVSGEMIPDGKTYEISSGRLIGNHITFTADGTIYNCKIYGNEMTGTAEKNGNITTWKADRVK